MERELIERTIQVLEQYRKHVLTAVNEDNGLEVTLLLNCLMGLLVYPQQLADKGEIIANDWLTNDSVAELGDEWGIKAEYIKQTQYSEVQQDTHRGKPYIEEVNLTEMSMRSLLRHMRNCTAHANFDARGGLHSNQIESIVFEAELKKGAFQMELPVEALNRFVHELAASALAAIEKKESERQSESAHVRRSVRVSNQTAR
jgi:hypothetical protein